MIIREMEARDIPAVSILIQQLTGREISADDMQNRLDMVENSSIDWLYVAEVEGQVKGFLGFRLRENIGQASRFGEISFLVTDANVRRSGIGRALVDYAEQLARETNCIGTWLVSGFNRKDEAHVFYERLGYEITGYRFVKMFDQ
jgi:GNAT superfamily N-acetyltransferase